MESEVDLTIKCSNCDTDLPRNWSSFTKKICPKCDSNRTTTTINIVDNFSFKKNIKGKVKNKKYNSKKNPRYKFFHGDELRKNDGKWMLKDRIIDKDNDKYFEKVTDPEIGEVIHYTEEPLSEHFHHGSAKFNKRDIMGTDIMGTGYNGDRLLFMI